MTPDDSAAPEDAGRPTKHLQPEDRPVPEADALEQSIDVTEEDEQVFVPPRLDPEVPEADALEQAVEEPLPEEYS